MEFGVITCPECGGDVRGLVHRLGCWVLNPEYLKGHQAAREEIMDDGWTAETAICYLALVGAPMDQFDRGHQAAIRELLEDQPGTGSPGRFDVQAQGASP